MDQKNSDTKKTPGAQRKLLKLGMLIAIVYGLKRLFGRGKKSA